ncbi:MAG: TonB-dependent receptor [Calditrichaeota bacterium]|nr:TonB-dependent receptor [Calditrichota bacterium]
MQMGRQGLVAVGIWFWILIPIVHAQDTSQVNILKFSLEELMQIQVATATRYQTVVADAPAPMFVITEQEIRERGYRTLLDVLHDVPGFDFTHVNGLYPQLVHQRGLRGNNNRTLIFIDGVPDQNLYEMNMLGASLDYDLTNVKQIEILYGPASALYGANAFSGVINIITKTGEDLQQQKTIQFGARMYAQGVQRSGLSGSFALGGIRENGDVSWAVTGFLRQDDGYFFGNVREFLVRQPPRGTAFTVNYDNSWVRAYQLNLYLRWKQLELRAYNWLYRMGQGTFNNGFWVFDHPVQNLNVQTRDGVVRRVNIPEIQWAPQNQSILLAYQTDLRPRWLLRSSFLYRITHLRPQSFDAEPGPVAQKSLTVEKDTIPGDNLYAVFYRRYSYSLRSDHWIQWEHAPAGKLTFGVQFEKMNVPLDYEIRPLNPVRGVFENWRLQPRVKILNLAAFAQEDYRLSARWLLFAGVRIDYYQYDVQDRRYGDVNYTTWNPRVSIIYQPSPAAYAKLFVGSAFRSPTPWELFSSTAFRIPNPDLKPEKKQTVELELFYTWKHLQLTLNGYIQQARDLIVNSVSTGEGDQTQNQNIGKVQVYGAELRARWKWGQSLSLDGNVTYQDPRYRSIPPLLIPRIAAHDGIHVPDLARFKANLIVTYRWLPGVQLTLRNNWVGKRETIATNPLPEVDGYWRMHVVVNLGRAGQDGINLQLGVDNVFNVEAWDPGLRAANGYRFPVMHPIGDRFFWVRIQYWFTS